MAVTIQRNSDERVTIDWVTPEVISLKINDDAVGHLSYLDIFKQCYPDIDIVSEKELISILGLDFEGDDYLEHEPINVTEIQVCAGTWKKIIGSNYWTFEKDFEWFMDETE